MMKSRGFWTVLVIAIFIGCPNRAYSQAGISFAQLNGSVRDEGGGTIAKAGVTLHEVDTNLVYTAATNESGFYALPNLPPGRYELKISFAGFSNYTQTGIELTVGQNATFDVVLKVASKGEQVVVTTEVQAIEPTKTEISQVIDTKQIESLPISGRLFTDFALLSPGVSVGHTSAQSPFTDPTVIRISFGGQRDLNNAVTVDGADNIMAANGSQRATPSQEAVSEFRVVNNSFGAEYGRALGGIVNIVTKSGTNEMHGSAYDYLQNNATNARSILTLPGFNTLRQNQFGATLGGPIQKDKTFFFVNYEGQRRAQSPTYPGLLFAPVDASVAGLFPAGSTNLQAINLVKQDMGIPPESLGVLKTADNDNGFLKLEHQFNKNNLLSVRYSILDGTALNLMVGETLDGGGIGLPSAGRNGLTRDQDLVGTWNWQASSTIVNSLLGQWARRNYGFPGVTGQPNLDVPNLLAFGHNFGAFDRYNESRVQFSDTVSWVKNKHLVKFGFDYNYVRNFVIWPGFTPSRDIFASLDDLLVSGPTNWNTAPCPFPLNATLPSPPFPPNTPALHSPCPVAFFWGAPIGPGPFDPTQSSPPVGTTWQNAFRPDQARNFDFSLNHSYWGFFAQDQWRITPKLTLNYGARYDFETGLGFLVNGDYHGIQPRVGLAYSPDPKTVIRAGYGMFYDRYTLTFFFVSGPQRPLNIPGLPTAKNMATGTWLLNSSFLGACQPSFVPPGLLTPPCPPGTVPSDVIDSQFTTFIKQGAFPANAPAFQGGSVVDRNERKPYSEQSSLEIDREIGKGLSINVGYLFVAAHHLVRPIDLNVAPHIGTFPGTNKDRYNFAIPVSSIPAPPGGSNGSAGIFYFTDSSGNSAHHGMTLQATEKAGKYFRLSANYTFSKTLDDGKFLVFVDTPQSKDQRRAERAISNQNVRHRFVANFVADAPEHSFLRNFELSSIVTVQSPRPFTLFVGFDANTDGNPVNDRVGESARDTYLGDHLRTVDMRVSRLLHLGEKYKLQLSVDSFNLFNRANVDEVFTVYGAPNFVGPVPQHYKDGIAPPFNPAFGTPRTVLNPRQFQFAAKLVF